MSSGGNRAGAGSWHVFLRAAKLSHYHWTSPGTASSSPHTSHLHAQMASHVGNSDHPGAGRAVLAGCAVRPAGHGAHAAAAGSRGARHARGLAAGPLGESSPGGAAGLLRQSAAGPGAVVPRAQSLFAAQACARPRIRLLAAHRPDPRRQPVGDVGVRAGGAGGVPGGNAAVRAAGRGNGQHRRGRVLPGLRRPDVYLRRATAGLLGRRRAGGVDRHGQNGRHRGLHGRPAHRPHEALAHDQPRQDGGRRDGRDRVRLSPAPTSASMASLGSVFPFLAGPKSTDWSCRP